MANVLAGVQGILELQDPSRPLGDRDRQRLDAVVEEGLATLARTRHLVLGTLPEATLQEGPDWRAELADELRPMGTLFKFRFDIALVPGTGPDLWPGTLLRSYLRAVARQVVPYVQGGTLHVRCMVEASGWQVRLEPVTLLPESLTALPRDKPGDISARWAVRVGQALGIGLSCEDGCLLIQVPRH